MFYIILILWIILDLGSKYLASVFLTDKINIIWELLYLKYVENTWIAFSIYIPIPILKILTISLIIWIFYYYISERKQDRIDNSKKNTEIEKKTKFLDVSFALILAWAIWNGIERVFYERVIDFIWVENFAIFNLADSFISIWAWLYIYHLYREKKL